MRRSPVARQGERAPAPAVERPPGRTPERTPEQRRAADDVYSFLTSFSAGVQRGLDESGRLDPADDRSSDRDTR
jgi:hypothetical protein